MKPAASHPARCLVYAGGLRASPLQAMCHMSVLSLPILPGVTALDRILSLIATACPEKLPPVLVVAGSPVPAPLEPRAPGLSDVSIVSEPKSWRGAAGIVRDTCGDLDADADILILEGARWFDAPLAPLLEAHRAEKADATIASSADLSPAGAYVLRRAALDMVPSMGFLDLKEQLFGRMSKAGLRLVVHPLGKGCTLPLRSLAQFLVAAKYASGGRGDWRVVDPLAQVDPSANVLSSVVLRNARIGKDALLARSLVLEGATVEAGAEIVDSVVGPGGVVRAPGVFRTMRLHERTA